VQCVQRISTIVRELITSLLAITLALGFGTSIVARVIGLFSLSLDLKHRFTIRFYELICYWFLLLSALGE
jgi:hypothetical protein